MGYAVDVWGLSYRSHIEELFFCYFCRVYLSRQTCFRRDRKNMIDKTRLTLPALFYNSVEKFADNTAVKFVGDDDFTYRQMGEDVELLAELLVELGIGKGDKVAILSANMPNWGKAFFALSVIGAVAVPILPDFHSNEIETIIEHSETKLLFVSEGLYKSVSPGVIAMVEHMVLVDNFAVIPKETPAGHLKKLKSSVPQTTRKFLPVNVEEEELASIIYTSGTTGNSKGVMLTHKNLAWTAQQSRTLKKVTPNDRFLSILPLSHTLENTVGFLLPFMYGASVHYLRKPPVPSVLMPALKMVRPTIMLTVPLIIEKIYRGKILPEFQKSWLTRFLIGWAPTRKLLHKVAAKKLHKTLGGHLHFFGIGGAKLDRSVEQFLFEGGFPYAIGYGLTETAPLLSGAVGKFRRVGSAGIAMKGVSLRIANPDPATGEGEIQAKGENVMKGYYKAPDITKDVFTDDGWFRTGDRGMFDKKNLLHIKGRIKTMIVGASGENIYPEEIESVINKMRFVMESLVVEKKGKLVAMIHLNAEEIDEHFKNLKEEAQQFISERSDEILQEIMKKVNQEVNKFSRINQVVLQPIPFERTPTRKIKRFLYA
ncbi:long-chain acyl-CoA synthetase [Draconibacterium orientale]|uniref:Long-chain acyl-CoA synthetase n=2 Tax=Draconibacterium orientale TaxID=1168034 RepID=A0A1H9Z3K8_9BACT|nr:long-chain acyl-CoA synthetase [Draconibacterium orientale]